jgi:uncharacterized membrane protein YtjA (UPF0391 family)
MFSQPPGKEPSRCRSISQTRIKKDDHMLGWALTFFILALIAAFLGFFAMAGLAAEIAKLLLIAFVVLLAISLITGSLRGRAPPV